MGWFEDLMKGAQDVATNVALPAAVNYGTNYLMAEEKRKQADKTYEDVHDKLMGELGQFDQDYEAELKGQVSPAEQASRDALLSRTQVDLDKQYIEAKNSIIQRYTSAGIGGQRLADEIAKLDATKADTLAKYQTELDATLMQRAMDRQMQVKQTRSKMLSDINSKLEPLAMAKAPVDTNSLAVQSVIPGAVAGVVGGVSAGLAGKDIGAAAQKGFRTAELTSAMKSIGLDPAMFNPTVYEPKGDYIPSEKKENPITGEEFTTRWTKNPDKATLKEVANSDPIVLETLNKIFTPGLGSPQSKLEAITGSAKWNRLSEVQKAAILTEYRQRTLTSQEKLMDFSTGL